MNLDKLSNIASLLIFLAIITTLVTHPETARIVSASSTGLARVIREAMGRGRRG